MFRCAVGQAEGLEGSLIIEQVLAQCASQLAGATPQAGILFTSGRYDFPAILRRIDACHPGLKLIGCSTAGDVTSQLGFSEDSLALLLLCSDELGFSIGVIRPEQPDPSAEFLRACAADSRPPALCLAFPAGQHLDSDRLIEMLEPILPPGCALFGGRAAVTTGSRYEALVQFCGTEVMRDSAPFLLIHNGGRLRQSFAVSNAWSPVGSRQRVTAAQGPWVLRIGEHSALEYYRYYLGPHSRPAAEFPLAVFEDDEQHYFLRVAQAFDLATGAVFHAGRVKEGALVQLTEAVRSSMLQDIANSATQAFEELARKPALALMISCAARKSILGTRLNEEQRIVASCLPAAVPVFGLYAWGEIAPCAPGWPSRTHNATLVTLLLSCDDSAAPIVVRDVAPPNQRDSSTLIDIVSYGANIVGKIDQEEPSAERALVNLHLRRSEYYRMLLEDTRELHSAMLRTINAEIEAARRKIEEQNQTLQRLYGELTAEKQKSEELLLSILPRDIAEELKRTARVEPIYYPMASVMFTDFVGFTRIAGSMSPGELLAELDFFFSGFDRIIEAHGLEKLKTIGDAYMCAAGVPTPRSTHAEDAVSAAWEIQRFTTQAIADRRHRNAPYWELRIGIHSGPLMAGVIGRKKFAYDIWGNTVNLASRLESTSEPGRINISHDTYEMVRHRFDCEPRGKVLAKNAGEIDMYFVRAPRSG